MLPVPLLTIYSATKVKSIAVNEASIRLRVTFSPSSYYSFNFVEMLCLVVFQWTKKDSKVPHMDFWNITDRCRLTSGIPVYHSH